MRTLCALSLVALFAVVAASANEPNPAPTLEVIPAVASLPADEAAPLAAAEAEVSAAEAEVAATEAALAKAEAALAGVDAELAAEAELAIAGVQAMDQAQVESELRAKLAEAGIADAESAQIVAKVQGALSGLDGEKISAAIAEAGGSYSVLAAPLAKELSAACAGGECPMAGAWALGGNREDLAKAIEELQASGDLTDAGAAKLKDLLNNPHAQVFKLKAFSEGHGKSPFMVAPDGSNMKWEFKTMPDGEGLKLFKEGHGDFYKLHGGQAMAVPHEKLMELYKLGETGHLGEHLKQLEGHVYKLHGGGDTSQLEGRIAELEAKLAELESKLAELDANE